MDFIGTVFISYARSDGRDFAEAFQRRLAAEGVHAWRDLKSMGAGEIRPQVLRAIEGAKHLVLILSPRALTSDWIKREWSHARLMGKQVSPVLAHPGLTQADLPAWMRHVEIFDIEPTRDRDAERWNALVLALRGDGRVKRTPYMPGDLPVGYVPRPAEFEALKRAVLAEAHDRTVALTTGLRGAGGYGKTTLANCLCRDPDIRFAFPDGILRVEIGKERADVTSLVSDLIEKLHPEGKRPGFTDVVTAAEHLGELLGESRILLVIDDVWREAQLRPFLRGGPNCVRVVTTRIPGVLPPHSVSVPIDEMRASEAAHLIGAGLANAKHPAIAPRLATLASRLGNWAQMLAVANGWLRDRVQRGEPLPVSIARFERRLAKDGPFAFDPNNPTQRDKAIRLCIEASTQDLDPTDAARFAELSILPEDEDVSLDVVQALWRETSGLDEDETDDLLRRLDALSLLQSLDLGRRTLRLHDNLLWYLRLRLGPENLRAAHAAMVRALRAQCAGTWSALSAGQTYGWHFLIAHLRAAGDDRSADDLLSDYAWIKAKLLATDARGLHASYFPGSSDPSVRRIGQTIGLALPALMADKRELARQLVGRLGDTCLSCATEARLDQDFRPVPRWPGLTPPGAELLCLRGHHGEVHSAAFSPDAARIVTASEDRTARIWTATTGAEIAVLRGHRYPVCSATFSPDGARVVTASEDLSARIWDVATGGETTAFRGHRGAVMSAAFSPDGTLVLTASRDRTARLWNPATGEQIAALPRQDGALHWAAFSPDGARIVTASSDRTVRIWDLATLAEIRALSGQQDGAMISAAFSPDATRMVTVSRDLARLWDLATGLEIAVLRGHDAGVHSAAFSPDGTRLVTASSDRTVRIWDAAAFNEIAAFRGHEAGLSNAAFSPNGHRIVTCSRDGTARIWELSAAAEIARPGHRAAVGSLAFSPDGTRIVSAAYSRTVRLWDAATGVETDALQGHQSGVVSAAFASDGARIITGSSDRTARIWDARAGTEVAVLRGHEGTVIGVAFSPDGACAVTASADRTVRVWSLSRDGEACLRGHENKVQAAAFSPDAARIVTASWDHTARIWDAGTAAEIRVLRGHQGGLSQAAFSPDGTRVVTASTDRTARIWDANTGAETTILRGHDDGLQSAVFSPDGARIITASWDRTARIWDARTSAELARMTLDAAVTALAIHDSAIALGDALGRIHVFDAGDFIG